MASPEELLEELRESEVFADDFPRRRRLTHAEVAARRTIGPYPPKLDAQSRLCEIVYELGRQAYVPAVPTLAVLWHDCAVPNIRERAGWALLAIGSPDARAALLELIEDGDSSSPLLAVRALLDEDPAQAFSRLRGRFVPARMAEPGGTAVPRAACLAFCLHGGSGWFWAEPRWLELCAELRQHTEIGWLARQVLRIADPALVDRALAECAARESPAKPPRTRPFGDLVERYRRGEHIAAWETLRSVRAIDGALRSEADALARETMRRVAANADRLAARLEAAGWKAQSGRLRVAPQRAHRPILEEIERLTEARLPPSLRAFWEVVGGIDFVWDGDRSDDPPALLPGRRIAFDELDPLRVNPPSCPREQEWRELIQETRPELLDPFTLALAPERLNGMRASGAPRFVELPFLGADPLFENDDGGWPFVDHLRHCFAWAGFPHLEEHRADPAVRAFVDVWTRDFEPF